MFGYTLKKEDAHAIKEYIGKWDIYNVHIFWSKWFLSAPSWRGSIEYRKWEVKIEKKIDSQDLEEVLIWIKNTREQLISMESK